MQFPEDVKEENENKVILYPPSSIEVSLNFNISFKF